MAIYGGCRRCCSPDQTAAATATQSPSDSVPIVTSEPAFLVVHPGECPSLIRLSLKFRVGLAFSHISDSLQFLWQVACITLLSRTINQINLLMMSKSLHALHTTLPRLMLTNLAGISMLDQTRNLSKQCMAIPADCMPAASDRMMLSLLSAS